MSASRLDPKDTSASGERFEDRTPRKVLTGPEAFALGSAGEAKAQDFRPVRVDRGTAESGEYEFLKKTVEDVLEAAFSELRKLDQYRLTGVDVSLHHTGSESPSDSFLSGREVFETKLDELLESKPEGTYVAILDGEIIAEGTDDSELYKSVLDQYGEEPDYIGFVHPDGQETIDLRG